MISNYTVEIVKQAKENLKLEDLVIINVEWNKNRFTRRW